MKKLTIKSDLINKKIHIVYGFEVDYNPELQGQNFNNNGTWGVIVNSGEIINTVSYDPNKHHNYVSDYEVKLFIMNYLLSVYEDGLSKYKKFIELNKIARSYSDYYNQSKD